ncbi:MAG: hypothetical protein NTX25_13530 [Proteobacteria bacterium]|nr:hypothetical protein [Pseudomonadota bacterium]
MAGTAPEQQKLADRRYTLKILHPLDGTLVAFDPDIPESQQAIFFEATAALPQGAHWVLDKKLSNDDHIRLSQLANGNHELEIQNRAGERLDSVSFEVRGRSNL